MEFNVEEAGRLLDKKLAQLRGKSYISEELINLLDEVAHLQLAARAEVKVSIPDELEIASPEQIIQGVSLVAREDFPYDAAQAEELLGKLIDLLKKMEGPLADAAKGVEAALESGDLTAEGLFSKYMQDDSTFFGSWAERCPDAPKAIAFLAFASLAPSIEATAAVLSLSLPDMKVPAVGTCPICGSLPLISSLEEKEGFRHATCSFCRHDYRIKRLACPVCGEEEQKKLTFFTVDEEPGFRVDVCESCKTYIKTIDFRELDRVAIPVLDDLDSLALDYVAAGQGYRRATLSAWGF
ncbi:formate dehydrogenase accessory protein FdhE [Pseudodesulfovibrio sp. zrk46]|uniref:formate dehydrogenase accessory protein FdhE n=1 Tax=Pseudodesulfovibrio sp. zrk46 TaxID=2725288 RepID=UPI00144901EF|nr:formate dehydrogenase accessory protein FdhE [Pseudodesulfovibrio sp. zrk46]QJB55804.1 formate dehydrogenase accessory protein FdhE [Pseudodesulfovibrio sp. zrk46]